MKAVSIAGLRLFSRDNQMLAPLARGGGAPFVLKRGGVLYIKHPAPDHSAQGN